MEKRGLYGNKYNTFSHSNERHFTMHMILLMIVYILRDEKSKDFLPVECEKIVQPGCS
jgi:hypothetical protein